MIIEDVETILTHRWLLVRVHTDSGISGIGEGGYWGYPDSIERIVHAFREYLIGQDPLRIEHHWQYLYRSSCFRGGALSAALAAIDIALWDIAGKFYQAPIHQLLGGKCRHRIRLYAMTGRGTVDELVQKATDKVTKGFSAIKIDPVPNEFALMTHAQLIREVVARVAAVREAVGPDIDIGVEIHRRFRLAEAIAIGSELERFRLLFYEDAIPPESIQSWSEVSGKLRMPIATGERLYNIYEFRELLESKGAHIVRPDLSVAGGLTHCKKIAALAESYYAEFMPHHFLSPVTTAACVQLDACIPNFLIQEYDDDHIPPKRDLLKIPIEPIEGYLKVPDEPGLGIELNEEFLHNNPFIAPTLEPPVRQDVSVAYA